MDPRRLFYWIIFLVIFGAIALAVLGDQIHMRQH